MGWQGGDADYQRLFSQSPVPTLVVDRAHQRILACNPAAERLLEGCTDALLDVAGTALVADLPEALMSGDAPRLVRRVEAERGLRTLELSVLPPNDDGSTFVQLHDITDLAAANAALLRHTADIEVRAASLETVSARIAHDLRTPLATIAGFVDLLRSSGPELADEQRATVLDRVSANAHRLATMVTDMLEDARRAAGGGSNAAEELLATVRTMFEGEKPDDARITTSASVEELPVPVGAVRQLVLNLVDNSIKFRAPDRPLEVTVDIRPADGGVEIVVEDNGTGFAGDPEELFESGVRGGNAAGVAGSGLGLSYARRAVEAIGGRLVAHARERGACLHVQLPAASEAVTEAASEGFAGGLSARQLDRIIDVAPVPMIIVDLTMQVVIRANTAAVELLGVPADQVVGRPAIDFLERPEQLVVPGHRAPATASVTRILAGERRVPAALWMVGFDDAALLIVQGQDLRGVVDESLLDL